MKAIRIISILVALVLYLSQPILSYGVELDYAKTPVFFVHGHSLSSSRWYSMINYLTTNGYPPQFLRAIDLDPNNGPNQPAAEDQIAPAIETFLNDVNTFLTSQGYSGPPKIKVDLVSHSMGGLSTRWYAAVVAPERVNTWLSIAGANHGTDDLCPYVGKDAGGAEDCCPAYSTDPLDTVQLTLNGQPGPDVDETPYGIGRDTEGVSVVPPDSTRRIFYATIRTEPDVWISPDVSAVVDGAGGRVIKLLEGSPFVETSPGNFLIANLGHDGMPANPDVKELVRLLLSPLVGAAFSCDSVTEVPHAECDALVALYNSTAGDSWTINTGWLATDLPCSWYGVLCVSGHITRLELADNQLTGSIPTQLGNLTNLNSLFLHANRLSGSIPKEVGNLMNLAWILLNNNQLTGSIPVELMNLTQLWDNESDFRFNHLYTTNDDLRNFLNSKQIGGDWESYQTPPLTTTTAMPWIPLLLLDD